jgi:hypothetical protein
MTELNTYSRRRLSYIVAEVSKRLKVIPLHGLTPELVPLVEASGAFVRGCWEAARGVLVLAAASEYGGIVAAERQAWEMWNELEYLLLSADPPRNGLKVQVNALIEVVELLTVLNVSPELLARNNGSLAELATAHPDVVAEVRQQRKKGRHHWSGQSRTLVVGKTDASRAVYKMLSWEAHPDIGPIRDISTEDRDGVSYLVLTDLDDVDTAVERSASNASECLLSAWNAFADSFGQAPIEGAPSRKPDNSE